MKSNLIYYVWGIVVGVIAIVTTGHTLSAIPFWMFATVTLFFGLCAIGGVYVIYLFKRMQEQDQEEKYNVLD